MTYYEKNRERMLAQQKEYYLKNREKKKAYQKEYNAEHKEEKAIYDNEYYANNREEVLAKRKKRYAENREEVLAKKKIYYEENKEEIAAYQKIYHRNNLKLWRYHGALRRARVRQQTPPWADLDKIKEIYLNCPDGYEVDHIHPISKWGLHVHWNLQHLPLSENRSKGAKIL